MKRHRHQPSATELENLTQLFNQGLMTEAEQLSQTFVTRFPKHGFAWKVLAIIHLEQKNYKEALHAAGQAIDLLPEDAAVYNNLGSILFRLERLNDAELNFRKALAIAPDYAKALFNLAAILRFNRKLQESEACCRRAIEIDPRYTNAHIALGNALELQNRLPEAQASYKAALAISPDMASLHTDLLHLLSLDVQIEPQQLFAEHLAFGEQFETPLLGEWPALNNAKDPTRCLQIGFVTGDLYDHALANFLEPFFKFLAPKSTLTLHVYYTNTIEDAVTQRMRAYLPRWYPVAQLDEAELAHKIQADGIDILIDLAGHTILNRLLTFARKPAPIQASWLGYLGTTGLQAMDYYVCDPFWIPPGELDWQFTEKTAYLPAAIVFQPNPLAPPINALPALKSGHITFGSFNRHNKINDSVIVLWSMLLRSVPNSKMVLGAIPPEYQDRLIQHFEHEGIDRDRLTFSPRVTQTDYLALHHQIDFCLDTFPHGGGATTAHAAWMGVPTLSLAGESPASRFGAAEMHHLGLDGFIANNIEDFVAKGRYWAEHTSELSDVRQGMRVRFNESALGQPQRFADNFEALLRCMWLRWCNDLPPASLAIETAIQNGDAHAPSAHLEPSAAEIEVLGGLYHQQRNIEAETLARRLMEEFPTHGFAWKILGSVLHALGRLDDALALQKKIIEMRPDDHEAHFNLACEFHQQGNLDEAVRSYIQALGLQPNNPIAYSNLGNILKIMGLASDAEIYCRQAIALQPDMGNAHNNLGNALHAQGKFIEAQASYRQALALKPDWADAYNNLAITLKDQGHWQEAKDCYRRALQIKPEWAAAHSNLLYCLSHDVHTQPQALYAEHLAFAERFEPPLRANWRAHTNTKDTQRSLRIGFVSGDFYDHALANFLEPVYQFLAHKPGLVLHAYYTHIYEDKVTLRMRANFAHWHAVASLSDDDLAEQIRADGIDILIDLTGHTAHNRLLTFARKPAPVQASWLGYLGTTGLQSMDYYLCDSFWVTPGMLDWQFTEKAAYLPAAVVFQPSELSPPISSLPALANGYITFGSFNRPNKLNESVIVLWSMLLKKLPNARMVLGGIPLDSQETLLQHFAHEGIAHDRLIFYPRSNLSDYLALHHQVDFCLDTFPYGGGATTAHAAWMGVPTLSLAGESPPSRFGSALMHQLGLDEFVATDIEDFIKQGSYWAANLTELARIRHDLRERFQASSLGQPRRLADHLETMLRMMWQRWCDDLPPAAIGIESTPFQPSPSHPNREPEPSAQDLETLVDLYNGKQHAQAMALAQDVIKRFPEHGLAWKILGSIHQAQERYEDSLSATQRAIALLPDDATNHNNLGVALLVLERLTEAEDSFKKAIAIEPDYGKALVNLGAVLQHQGKLEEAQACCHKAIAVDASDASAHIGLGNALEKQGKLSEAQASYYRADMAHEPRKAVAHSNVLYLLNHDVLVDAQHLLAEHLAFGEQFEKPLRDNWLTHANVKDPERCLQVGFVSGDLNHHALANFLEPVFKGLAKKQGLKLHAYYTHTFDDEVTQRMRSYVAHWHDVAGFSDEDLADRIRTDGIDILIDLTGHTACNRLLTFARKPAPIQVSWLGYLGTTGLQAMDYYLCDSSWIPPGEFDWAFTEKLAYLPTAVVFQPSESSPGVNALPALSNGYVTFGSFNRHSKINDSVIALWSMLLRSVPTAKLVLGAIPPECQATLIESFASQHIDKRRLSFFARAHTADYLALHQKIDFCIDTFPHGGGATTAHAAWMGVPTLSLAGETTPSRFSATLMHHLGLGDFVSTSIEEFVDKGRYWSEHITELAALRMGMRDRFRASPLGQHAAFADEFEQMLRGVWQRWCDGLEPAMYRALQNPRTVAIEEIANEGVGEPLRPCIKIVSATKLSEPAFWSSSALGLSVERLRNQGCNLAVDVAFENSQGLPTIFNNAIREAAADDVLVFIHDDVWIDEFNFVEAVIKGLDHFDVIGIAGNRRRVPNQPAWAFIDPHFTWDDKTHLSGWIAHGESAFGQISDFGAVPAECELLDGVFLATRKTSLAEHHVQFDPQFDFHFYDMDFCRSARNAGLRLGTWRVNLTHQSGGAFGSQHWLESYQRYLNKWESPTVMIRENSTKNDVIRTDEFLKNAVSDALKMASDCENTDQIQQAESIYLEILKIQPGHVEASLHLQAIQARVKEQHARLIKSKISSKIHTFCITHKPLELPLPDDIPVVWLGSAPIQTNGKHLVYPVGEISEEFDVWHTFLGGSSGTFAINKMIRENLIEWQPNDRISIMQYRKFMAKTPMGIMSKNYPGLYLTTPSELKKFDFHALQKRISTPYLLPQPLKIENLYLQYASCHCIPDLLRYTALAVDLNIINSNESFEFLNSTHLIPGGVEFGIYPIEVFMDIIEKLKTISIKFLKTHSLTSSNPYQRRGLSFCNERLGSYFLLKELNKEYKNNIPNEFLGFMHTVTEGDTYAGGNQ